MEVALKEDKWIFRESEPVFLFKPTNTVDCFYVKVLVDEVKVGRCCNPKAENILVTNYMVAE